MPVTPVSQADEIHILAVVDYRVVHWRFSKLEFRNSRFADKPDVFELLHRIHIHDFASPFFLSCVQVVPLCKFSTGSRWFDH